MSGALLRYRVMAYVVGVMLIVVFVSIPFQAVEQVGRASCTGCSTSCTC